MRTRLFMKAALLCIMCLPQFLFAQNKTIAGTVTDPAGTALPGVTVAVNGTNQGVVTDASGRFSLSVSPNATITISSTGYKSQTVKASEATSELQIKLEEDIAKLDEVVVTGYTRTPFI